MEIITPSKNYESLISDVMKTIPSIYAVAILEENNKIVFSTNNWDISNDSENVCSNWDAKKATSLFVSGIKYTIIQHEIDSLVATSLKGEGHIIGIKDDERKIITYVEPNGDIKGAIVELSRILRAMSSREPYFNSEAKFSERFSEPRKGADTLPNQELKTEIESFLNWIKDPNGLQGYVNFYLINDNQQVIAELAKLYSELTKILKL
ncbi:MAG TPA: hypothetical protein VGB37_17855 [Candidatus Lokiarchaeia archaeon]